MSPPRPHPRRPVAGPSRPFAAGGRADGGGAQAAVAAARPAMGAIPTLRPRTPRHAVLAIPTRVARAAMAPVAAMALAVAALPAQTVTPVIPTALAPVPQPAIEQLEPTSREQLREQRHLLDRLLERHRRRGDVPRGELAAAFGDLGRLYFLHDLLEPAAACLANAAALDPPDFRWPYFLGALHRARGELEAARHHLRRALELRPGDAPALLRLGEVELDRLDLDAGSAAYAAAVAADPASAAAHAGLGRVEAARGEPAAAAEHFHRALELQPRATSLHHLLGLAYRSLGDLERARHHLALNRHDPVIFPDPLVDELSGLLTGARVHLKAGNLAVIEGDLAAAVAAYRQAVAADPADPLTHYNLGWALAQAGAEQEAVAAFRAALEADPDYRNAHFNLATALARQGRHEEATLHYERAYRIDPLDRRAHLEWALALERSGRQERAEEELRRLLAAGRRDAIEAPARLHLARHLLHHRGRAAEEAGRGEEALAHYRAAAQLLAELPPEATAGSTAPGTAPETSPETSLGTSPGEPWAAPDGSPHRLAGPAAPRSPGGDQSLAAAAVEVHLGVAAALARGGRFGEAAAAYGRAIELGADDPGAHFGRGMALILGGEYPAARAALEASLEALPDSLPLAHALARLLATCPQPEVRDGERALALARQVFAAQQSLDHAETLAMAVAEAGRPDEAAGLQRRVVAELERQGAAVPPDRLTRARHHLARYERGDPVRAPWQGAGG